MTPISYRIVRGKAPILWDTSLPPTPEMIKANAAAAAEWIANVQKHRARIARLGGLATKGISTPKKRRSSRENGRKGGRPRNQNVAVAVTANQSQQPSKVTKPAKPR